MTPNYVKLVENTPLPRVALCRQTFAATRADDPAAAVEGAIAGIPAFAMSTGEHPGGNYGEWRDHARTEAALPTWQVTTDTAVDIIRDLLAADVFAHAAVMSVNMPWGATRQHERRVTTVAPVRYGQLFRETEANTWQHDRAPLHEIDVLEGTDHQAVADDVVSMCPLGLSSIPTLPTNVRDAVTRAAG